MTALMLLGSWTDSQLFHMVPLVVAISLVYGATRHELIGPILHQSFKARPHAEQSLTRRSEPVEAFRRECEVAIRWRVHYWLQVGSRMV